VPALSPAVNDSRAALSRALKGLGGNAAKGAGLVRTVVPGGGGDRL